MVPCGLWMLQQDVVPRDVLSRVVEPCTAHRVPHAAHVEDARRGKKFGASAKQMPSAGSCVAGELFLVELAQWLCLPPLANFHKLLWNAGGSLELSGRGSELCTAALW